MLGLVLLHVLGQPIVVLGVVADADIFVPLDLLLGPLLAAVAGHNGLVLVVVVVLVLVLVPGSSIYH